ncbi:hypothetical protein MRX96_059503 [Rhipicephalus microplus]
MGSACYRASAHYVVGALQSKLTDLPQAIKAAESGCSAEHGSGRSTIHRLLSQRDASGATAQQGSSLGQRIPSRHALSGFVGHHRTVVGPGSQTCPFLS